ncbi:MAG: hypothetical protein QM831_23375 [Kofleriaceae bacterium]
MGLAQLRLRYQCSESWSEMDGDDRARHCSRCDKKVIDLSALTSDEATAVLADPVTPCVRFVRRPDGSVKTRLAVIAASVIAAPVYADPDPKGEIVIVENHYQGIPDDATPAGITITTDYIQGIPVPARTFEQTFGAAVPVEPEPRVEWSLWGRLGGAITSHSSDVLARATEPPATEHTLAFEAALDGELTFRVARSLRAGVYGELRTTTDPVVGAELLFNNVLVFRGGGNSQVVTGGLGAGYVGRLGHHVFGSRLMATLNRSQTEWSLTVGLEIDPIGILQKLLPK